MPVHNKKKTATSQQSEDSSKKGDKTVNAKDTKTIDPGQRDDNDSVDTANTLEKMQTVFVVRMNGSEHRTNIYFHDSFYSDDSGNLEETNDDTIIGTIYDTIICESFNEMLSEYTEYERRTLSKLYKMGRNSNEFHRALHFENKDKGRNIIIDRKKTSDFDIVRSIYEFSHVYDNGGDNVVFDFDMLLVNMTADDDVFYDKVDRIWYEHCNQDNSKKDSGSVDVKLPNKKHTDKIEADQDDYDHCDANQGTTTNNRKVVYSRTDQNEDIGMDISNHDTTTGNQNVMSNFKIDKDRVGYGQDSEPKSSDHILDQCPTHCITSKANLLDKSKVVKRDPKFKKAGMKTVNTVTFENVKPDSPTNESSGEDLCTTFGHLTNEEPTEVLDVDDHMVRRIAMEMKDDYNACASHPFDIMAIGRFISRINDHIVFTQSEIEYALEKVVEMGEDFSITLCSDSFDVLPTGEENKAGALTRIDLDQFRHVSALHNEVTMSLNQGKMGPRSDTAVNEPELDISDSIDSDGNLRLDIFVVRQTTDDMIEPDARRVAEVVKSKEILSKQSQFSRRGLQRRDDWNEWKAAENKMLEEMLKCNRDVVSNFKNETEILSAVNDVTADDSIVISEDNKSDIATSGEDGFFSCPEAGCDEPSGNQIPTL